MNRILDPCKFFDFVFDHTLGASVLTAILGIALQGGIFHPKGALSNMRQGTKFRIVEWFMTWMENKLPPNDYKESGALNLFSVLCEW